SGPLQGYVWHCHMLDHEDHDMMLGFRTVAE
ncbi:multicopper oxidase domain-containing protein, partial [Rhodococcus hoagii]|nr:multicopper oxidase domain-containing protein [Prescottella equi]